MTELTFLERFLAHPASRQQALEFLRVVTWDPECRLDPKSTGPRDPLHAVIMEARANPLEEGSVKEYLAVPAQREFLKIFFLFLISSFRTEFQPSEVEGWELFDDVIQELLREGKVSDPVQESGMDRKRLSWGDPGEYLLGPQGESTLRLHADSFQS